MTFVHVRVLTIACRNRRTAGHICFVVRSRAFRYQSDPCWKETKAMKNCTIQMKAMDSALMTHRGILFLSIEVTCCWSEEIAIEPFLGWIVGKENTASAPVPAAISMREIRRCKAWNSVFSALEWAEKDRSLSIIPLSPESCSSAFLSLEIINNRYDWNIFWTGSSWEKVYWSFHRCLMSSDGNRLSLAFRGQRVGKRTLDIGKDGRAVQIDAIIFVRARFKTLLL